MIINGMMSTHAVVCAFEELAATYANPYSIHIHVVCTCVHTPHSGKLWWGIIFAVCVANYPPMKTELTK